MSFNDEDLQRKKMKNKKIFTSRQEALNFLLKKQRSAYYKEQARQTLERLKRGNVGSALSQAQIQSQQAQRRQSAMGVLGGRAEQLEIWAVSLNEVPYLHSLEAYRMRACSPPDNFMTRTIFDATRICTPNDKVNSLWEKFDISQLPD